ncbi:hypothetical protein MNV_1740046 [Candidatus Methanoperedens nitroreducens]|uniref:Uncharacterized protein n=2 Tax=Candidatus Methanoperedens nitratireducens TaxID=1392998 RepID=A0A284VLZ4_9EURY|nr:hypothetical protein MNV_1740046 [Candidatus Methanoperedens nitroreducens]
MIASFVIAWCFFYAVSVINKGGEKMVRTQRKNLTICFKLLATFTLLVAVVFSSQTAIASSTVQQSTGDVSLSASDFISISSSDVRTISDGSVIPGAGSKLIRTDEGVTMELHTSELPAKNAVTTWWVIFNKPENCTEGQAPLRCGEGDLGNPDVQASVMFAAGSISSANGKATFGSHLSVGDTEGCQTGLPCSQGLTDPKGADIHLIVRDHGPIIPDMLDEQISTFGGGCNNAPPDTGKPGPNTCEDLQFSAHEG